MDKVRQLQRRQCIAAKCQRVRRFHALCARPRRRDVLPAASKRSVHPEARMLFAQTIGKPYAGNPHVRFERGPQETEPARHRA